MAAVSNFMNKALVLACTILSVLIEAYCRIEYELPHAQYTKVLAELKSAGINDPDVIERIHWSIVGVQTTWTPLFIALACQTTLLVILLVKVIRERPKTQRSELSTPA